MRFKYCDEFMIDIDEFNRWFRSAKNTLNAAHPDFEAGNYNWVCFKCHQAIEKALKAILWGLGRSKTGHSLVSLIREIENLDIRVPHDIFDDCAWLSKYYMITRYPNTWESGIPEDYFTRQEAEEALRKARKILEWVERTWQELLRKEKEKEIK